MLRRTLLGSLLAVPALAQEAWPSRTLRLVVAFAAGGAADTAARTVGQKLAEILGQSVVIENRTGGNAVVAQGAIMGAPKDGYSFLVDAANQLTNTPLMKDPPFDYRRDFVPVSQLCDFPQVIAVKQEFPARSIQEFVAYLRANPGRVSYGTPPAAGMAHLAGEEFQRRLGVRMVHTPYRGGADAARDITAGIIDAVLITTNSIRPPVQAGKAHILAVTSAQRVPTLPDVPTIAETVLPGFEMNDWNGIFAARGVPEEIIHKLAVATGQACREASVRERMDAAGAIMVGSTPEGFATWLDRQRGPVEEVIRAAGITLG
jgi:tripartite-type tricarboxylate transporter receptor subunit TctC